MSTFCASLFALKIIAVLLSPIVGDSYDSSVTLVGRIVDHSRESLISGEFQWKSTQTSKSSSDRPRRVYFLFTLLLTCRRNPPIVGDRLGCISQIEIIPILPIRSATVWDVTSTMFTFVVKVQDYRGPEKSPTLKILKILTTSENQALLVTIRIWQHTLCHCKTYLWQQI